MKYANLGGTGISVSRICLGMMTYGSRQWRDWVLEYPEAKPFVTRALEAGVNFFDTADVYSNGASEEVLGRALREIGVDRNDVVIATKCNFGAEPLQPAVPRRGAGNDSAVRRSEGGADPVESSCPRIPGT